MRWRRMRKQDIGTWHNWYAWYWVSLTEHGGYTESVVWLETVQRRMDQDGYEWEYRQ